MIDIETFQQVINKFPLIIH